MTPKSTPKPEWFELTENNTSSSGLRKVNKILPVTTLVVAGVLILGGSIFANTNGESSANAETPTATQSAVADATSAATTTTSSVGTTTVNSPSTSSTGVPTIAPQITGGFSGGDDHEGREHHPRGEQPEGEFHPERPEHEEFEGDDD